MSNSTINPGSKADFLTFLQTENDLDPEFLDSEFLEIVAETLEGLDDLTVSEEGDTNVGEGEMHPQSEGQRGEGSGSSRSDSRELVLLKSAAKQRTWAEVFKAALDASETDTSGGTRAGTADGQTGDQAGMAKEDAQISSRGSDTNAMTKGAQVLTWAQMFRYALEKERRQKTQTAMSARKIPGNRSSGAPDQDDTRLNRSGGAPGVSSQQTAGTGDSGTRSWAEIAATSGTKSVDLSSGIRAKNTADTDASDHEGQSPTLKADPGSSEGATSQVHHKTGPWADPSETISKLTGPAGNDEDAHHAHDEKPEKSSILRRSGRYTLANMSRDTRSTRSAQGNVFLRDLLTRFQESRGSTNDRS